MKDKVPLSEMKNQIVVGKHAKKTQKNNVNENGNLLINFFKLHNLL